MTPDQNPPVDPAALALSVSAALAAAAETKVLPRKACDHGYLLWSCPFPHCEFREQRTAPAPIDPIQHPTGVRRFWIEASQSEGKTFYGKIYAHPGPGRICMVQDPEGTSPKAPPPVDDRPQALLYDNLLVVWRDNGECLITTRKYPDDTGVNGPQCWPRGISGNYLATHCRAPIFHRSALDIVTGPAKIDASKILCDLGAAQIQISTLTDALTKAQAVIAKWADPKGIASSTACESIAEILDAPALVQALKGGAA